MKNFIRPGSFSQSFAADGRRGEFDIKNSVIVENNTKVDICFIGDSITHFWELNAYFSKYGIVINRGISGDIPEGVLKRFDADVVQLKPEICVMMVGINELWQFDAMFGQGEEAVKNAQKIKIREMSLQYREICEKCKNNGIKLLFCSVMPVDHNLKIYDYRNCFVRDLNEIIKSLCGEYGFQYVDYYSKTVTKRGNY